MQLKDPFRVYTAETNIEAHLVVEMLENQGVPAFAVEDLSTAGLWMFGTIRHIHKPEVWVERPMAELATKLIVELERSKRDRAKPRPSDVEIMAVCEECGKAGTFPGSQNGTVQECPYCRAYMDVGEFEWDSEFADDAK